MRSLELGEFAWHNWDKTGDCLECGAKGVGFRDFADRADPCPAAVVGAWAQESHSGGLLFRTGRGDLHDRLIRDERGYEFRLVRYAFNGGVWTYGARLP